MAQTDGDKATIPKPLMRVEVWRGHSVVAVLVHIQDVLADLEYVLTFHL